MVRLENVLESWKTVREDTAQAVEDFAAQDMGFRAADGMLTFRETAEHILASSHGIIAMMLAGEDNLARPDFRERVRALAPAPPEGAAALAAELRKSAAALAAELAARPAEFFAGIITRFDGQPVTRLEMLQFMKEHELTHRAQLFVSLRMKGIVPSTTRRRLARQGAR